MLPVLTHALTPFAMPIPYSNGVVHFVDADTKRVLFSQELGKPKKGCNRAFASLCFVESAPATDGSADGEHLLVALTTSGQLFYFTNVDLPALRDSIENKDLAGAQQVRAGIRMTHTSVAAQHTDSVNGGQAVMLHGEPHVVTWGSGAAGLSLWKVGADGPVLRCSVGRALGGREVTHAAPTTDGKLVVLTSDTAMSVWLLPELVQLAQGSPGYAQFELFECAVDDTTGTETETETTEVRVAAVTVADDGATAFKVVSLRGWEEHYALELSPTASIANVADQESMWVVEGKHLGTAEMAFQIRCLSPTLPLNRFYNLLHKHKFDEAMQLAHLFGLDLEMVHRVKVYAQLVVFW